MAKTTQTIITDDITGAEGAQPRTFVLNGETFHIDLTDATHAMLLGSIRPILSQYGRTSRAVRPTFQHARTAEGRARRNEQIVRMRKDGATYETIARAFKLSGQRVAQIVKENS